MTFFLIGTNTGITNIENLRKKAILLEACKPSVLVGVHKKRIKISTRSLIVQDSIWQETYLRVFGSMDCLQEVEKLFGHSLLAIVYF